jgi:uncharacterized protein
MKVFLDTNVFVAAFASRGLCGDLLRVVLAEHELLVGEVVLVELRRILKQKIKLPGGHIEDLVSFLRQHTLIPRPRRHLGLSLGDPDDEWVVASAIAGDADMLVTGDALLLAIVSPPLPIVSPRGLWQQLSSRGGT